MARKTKVSPELAQQIKDFYAQNMGYHRTAIHFGTTFSVVRGIIDPNFLVKNNERTLQRYYRMRKEGLCHMCGQPRK